MCVCVCMWVVIHPLYPAEDGICVNEWNNFIFLIQQKHNKHAPMLCKVSFCHESTVQLRQVDSPWQPCLAWVCLWSVTLLREVNQAWENVTSWGWWLACSSLVMPTCSVCLWCCHSISLWIWLACGHSNHQQKMWLLISYLLSHTPVILKNALDYFTSAKTSTLIQIWQGVRQQWFQIFGNASQSKEYNYHYYFHHILDFRIPQINVNW